MGLNASCQEEWCVKPALIYCDCTKKTYCSSCFTTHMGSKVSHNAYSPSTPSLILQLLKYRKSDGSTEVYEGLYKSSPVIIKIQNFTSKSDLNRKQEEAALQRSTRHPNICRCLKSYLDESHNAGYKFVMIIERALRDLDEEIADRSAKNEKWSEKVLLEYLNSMVSALAFMQENHMTHRDIKPANILYFENGILKLADFGLSLQEEDLDKSSLGVVGTVMYLSPILMKAYDDIQKGRNHSGLVDHNPYKSDVFSLGLTFLFMATLVPPHGLNYNIEGTTYLHHKLRRYIGQLEYSDELKRVLTMMLEVDEESRLDFKELKNVVEHHEPVVDNEPVSFGVSDINMVETQTDLSPVSITLVQILEDPCLPAPIKSALESVKLGDSLIISHTLLINEADYIRIALQDVKLALLDLSDCRLGYRGLKVIFQADLSSIKNLSLGNNDLGKRGAKYISKNFKNMQSLRVLRVWSNRFTDKGARYLFEHMPEYLEEIFLADNMITDEGAGEIAKKMPSCIKVLSLCDNAISDNGIRVLSVALSNFKITQLFLDNNQFGAQGVKYLVTYLPMTMKSLRITGNLYTGTVKRSSINYKIVN